MAPLPLWVAVAQVTKRSICFSDPTQLLFLLCNDALFVLSQHHHSSSSFFFSFVHHLLCSSFITICHHGFFSKPFLRPHHSSSLLACQDMVLSGFQNQEGNSANADLPLYCNTYYTLNMLHIITMLLSHYYLLIYFIKDY